MGRYSVALLVYYLLLFSYYYQFYYHSRFSPVSTLREKSAYIDLEQKNVYLFYSLREFFFAIKKNLFGSNVYFFTLKTHFLKVKTLFYDLLNFKYFYS